VNDWPSTTLPLPDQIELLVKQLDALRAGYEAAKAGLEADIAEAIGQAEPLPDEVIAELYWRFETIPAGRLAKRAYLIAREHPYWYWTCPGCGDHVPVGSRGELKELRHPGGYRRLNNRCDRCRERDQAGNSARWREEQARQRERDHQMRTMPYRDYLLTPEWAERRKAALKRARYACQVCNRQRPLHVHHRTYERRGDELSADLIVLCDECHALYHGKGLLAEEPR
jgi:5-methylcytosine-specific restriction endonuclease McrA